MLPRPLQRGTPGRVSLCHSPDLRFETPGSRQQEPREALTICVSWTRAKGKFFGLCVLHPDGQAGGPRGVQPLPSGPLTVPSVVTTASGLLTDVTVGKQLPRLKAQPQLRRSPSVLSQSCPSSETHIRAKGDDLDSSPSFPCWPFVNMQLDFTFWKKGCP